MRYPLLIVEWDDAETFNGWEPVPSELNFARVITVGFLAKETEKHMMLVASFEPEGLNTNERMQIPKGMIISRREINADPQTT